MNRKKIGPGSEMTPIDSDRFLVLDQTGTKWTNQVPGDKVGPDRGLPGKMSEQAKHPGEQDA